MGQVTVTMTDEQLRLISRALEEYFRLRLNQWWDFADDACMEGIDLSADNPMHDDIFADFIYRRDLMKSLFEDIYRKLTVQTFIKTQDCMDMIDMWQTIRYWFWKERPAKERKEMSWCVDSNPPLHEGQYPLLTIQRTKW